MRSCKSSQPYKLTKDSNNQHNSKDKKNTEKEKDTHITQGGQRRVHVTEKEDDSIDDHKPETTVYYSQVKRPKDAPESDIETEDKRPVPPLPIENCQINGVHLEGTQDTAANINAIKPQIACKLGLETKKVVPYSVKGISGAVMVTEEVSANTTVGRETVHRTCGLTHQPKSRLKSGEGQHLCRCLPGVLVRLNSICSGKGNRFYIEGEQGVR